MLATIVSIITGPLVGKLTDVFVKWQERKMSEAVLRAELQKAVLDAFADVSKEQGKVIIEEMRGESALQRLWRPVVAVSFASIILFYALILPISVDWFGAPPVRVGDTLLGWVMDAVTLCLGGYIAGRSFEKIASLIIKR